MSVSIFGAGLNEAYEKNVCNVRFYEEAGFCDVVLHKKLTMSKGWEEVVRDHEDMFGALSSLKTGTTTSEDKLNRSARRVRTVCRNLLFANRWTHWVTLTVSAEKCNRYGFDEILKRVETVIKARNRKTGENLRYLLIPERHEDGAYHLHGFLAGFKRGEVTRNEYGYLTIPMFSENLGFDCVKDISHKPIEEYRKILAYTLKYATKAVEDKTTRHAYYHSQGLYTGTTARTVANDEIIEFIQMKEGFENEYCRKITLEVGSREFERFCGLLRASEQVVVSDVD